MACTPPDADHAGEQRESELAAASLRSAREESAYPAERGLLFLLWHDQQPRVRRDRRDQGVGGAALPVRELGLLRGAELGDQANVWKVLVCRLGAPGTERVWPMAALPLTRSNPATHSTWLSRTFHRPARMPPGTRTLAISGPATAMSNQCRALSGQYGIDGRVRQRNRLGTTRQGRDKPAARSATRSASPSRARPR